VEDSELNARILKNQATKLGLEVKLCENGQIALEYCKKHPMPELVLLDGSMPEMDGHTFLKEMRQLPDGDQPYVVFCSCSMEPEAVVEVMDSGAECYFPKPVSRDQIIYALQQALNRYDIRLESRVDF
jgi:CheY-like chemotaxis protein